MLKASANLIKSKFGKKVPVPIYSHTSPKNSLKQESTHEGAREEQYTSTKDNGFKNFVIDSSAGRTASNKKPLETANTNEN